MSLFNLPVGTIVVVPHAYRGWVGIVRDIDGLGAVVPAKNAEDLQDEATAFLMSFGPADLDGGMVRVCPPELAVKAIFPDVNWRPF